MNTVAKIRPDADATTDPLAKLREPFAPNQISKLPKETKAQADQRKADQAKNNWPARCTVCGGLHHKNAVHLDYVGHAALTDRLLNVDPHWSWEPVGFAADGLPAFDRNGGLWIKLTVCGMTRLGYGHAGDKTGGDAVKEIIGDALRNAAMRFGAALDLWHKGDLHAPSDEGETTSTSSAADMAIQMLRGCGDVGLFKEAWAKNKDGWKAVLDPDDAKRVWAVKDELVAKFTAEAEAEKPKAPAQVDPFDDEIPFG